VYVLVDKNRNEVDELFCHAFSSANFTNDH
jgi:hypothetical protein